MAEVAARARFVLDVDGDNVPRQVRQMGDKIAAEGDKAGKDYGDRFERGLTPRMREAAARAGTALNDGLKLDGSVLRRNKAEIEKFSRDARTAFGDMFPKSSKAFDDFESRIRSTGYAFRDAGHHAKTFWDRMDVDSTRLHGLNLQWKDLGHNTRQWTLIIGAVLAAMQDLAVLSSAAGAGLFAVGGALGAAVVGAGGAVAVFTTLSKEIGELPPELRDVAGQFRNLGKELIATRDIISAAAFRQMPDTFDRLSATVRALDPEMAALGTMTGKFFDDFSKGVEEGSEGFEELRGFIRNGIDDFPALAKAAGTWATALLRGINRANPMVDQLIGYVQELGDRFDRFTKSDSFGQWIANSMTTWTRFGELLDATGRALNDLVTPAAVVRTQAFLGNLTDFMPNLSRMLDIIGRLDVFGLAAQLLNDFGAALEPLAEPLGQLADSLNDVASILIERLAAAVGSIAPIVGSLAQGLANVIDAIPPEALQGAATAVIALAGAFVVLKGVQGIAGAVSALQIFSGWGGKVESAAGKMSGAIRGSLTKAGMVGIAIVGVLGLVEALKDMAWEMSNIEGVARNVVASNGRFADSILEINQAWTPLATEMTNDWDTILNDLDGFDAFWSGFNPDFGDLGSKSKDLFNDLTQLTRALDAMDPSLASLASQNLPAATAQFSAWAREIGASDEQVLAILNKMPEFKGQLESAALASGNLATDQALVDLALNNTKFALENNTAALELLGSTATLTGSEVDSLSAKILGFGSANLSTRDAARQFEEALDNITESLAVNGATLDINTAQGRQNEATLDQLATSTLNFASATLKQTGDQQAANNVIADGRQRLIEMLGQFGITGQAAENYADDLGLIPATKKTEVGLTGAEAAQAKIDELARDRSMNIRVTTSGVTKIGNREITAYARGGTVTGPQHALIGEAGPEAVVPLNRPLSQVDESVRWLSAIAQGKGAVPMANGGVAGGGRVVNVEAGAIVVQAAEDPRRTALEVADEVAERAAS